MLTDLRAYKTMLQSTLHISSRFKLFNSFEKITTYVLLCSIKSSLNIGVSSKNCWLRKSVDLDRMNIQGIIYLQEVILVNFN